MAILVSLRLVFALLQTQLAGQLVPMKPSEDIPREEKIQGQLRLLKLQRIRFALSRIESCKESIILFSSSNDPAVRAYIPMVKKELTEHEKTMEQFEANDFKQDPSLLKHAKLINEEQKRLDKIAMAKGKEYINSEEGKQDFIKKMAEFCKQFEKPE